MAESSKVQNSAMDRTDGVVEVLADVEAENRPPRLNLDRPHPEQSGYRGAGERPSTMACK